MEHIEYNIAESLKFLDGYVRTSKNEIDQSVAYGIAARYYHNGSRTPARRLYEP